MVVFFLKYFYFVVVTLSPACLWLQQEDSSLFDFLFLFCCLGRFIFSWAWICICHPLFHILYHFLCRSNDFYLLKVDMGYQSINLLYNLKWNSDIQLFISYTTSWRSFILFLYEYIYLQYGSYLRYNIQRVKNTYLENTTWLTFTYL